MGTREQIVQAARMLFWERGYEPTTLAEVSKRAGVNAGSTYYFFRSKEELLLAVLDHYVELLWPEVIAPAFRAAEDPVDRIFAILDGYRKGLVYTNCTHGCPLGNLAIEVGDAMPNAREKIASNMHNWRGWIRKCLEDATAGFPQGSDTEALATFVLSAMEGAVMQARVFRSLDPFDQTIDHLKRYLTGLRRPKSKRKGSRK